MYFFPRHSRFKYNFQCGHRVLNLSQLLWTPWILQSVQNYSKKVQTNETKLFILYLCCVLKHASAHCLSEAEETDV